MGFRSDGDLVPSVQGQCSPGCELCVQVCPFGSAVYDPRPLNEKLFGPNYKPGAMFHHHIGWYSQCLVGYSKVDAHRYAGASGGLATWVLEALLRDKIVDRVAVVTRSHGDNRLFKFSVAASAVEVRSASGSVYYPVEISDLLKLMLSGPGARWGVIGLPCLVYAVRRASLEIPRIADRATVLLGLCCGMLQNRYYTDLLVTAAGMKPSHARSIIYRGESTDGDPGNYVFSATDSEGRVSRPIAYRGIPYYLGRNAYFRLNACNYCMDVFAEAADACFMDAWLPEYRKEPRGTSIVVVRSGQMRVLLSQGRAAGELKVEDIEAESVCLSQAGQIRRKRELISMRLGALYYPQGGRHVAGALQRFWSTLRDGADWWLERHAQRRSKTSWARWGQRYGLKAFWLFMADLVLFSATLHGAARVGSKLKSLVSRVRH